MNSPDDAVHFLSICHKPTDQVLQDNSHNLIALLLRSRQEAEKYQSAEKESQTDVTSQATVGSVDNALKLQEWWYKNSYTTLFEPSQKTSPAHWCCNGRGGVTASESVKAGDQLCKPIPLRSCIYFRNVPKNAASLQSMGMYAFVPYTQVMEELVAVNAVYRNTTGASEAFSLWNLPSLNKALRTVVGSWQTHFDTFGKEAYPYFRREYACTCDSARRDALCSALEHTNVNLTEGFDTLVALGRHTVEIRDPETGEPLAVACLSELIQHMLAPDYRISHHMPETDSTLEASAHMNYAAVLSGKSDKTKPRHVRGANLATAEPNAAVYAHLDAPWPYFTVMALRDIEAGEPIVASLGRGIGPWRPQDRTLRFVNPTYASVDDIQRLCTSASTLLSNVQCHLEAFVTPQVVKSRRGENHASATTPTAREDRQMIRSLTPHMTDAVLALVRHAHRFKSKQRREVLHTAKQLSTYFSLFSIRHLDYVLWLHVLIQRLQSSNASHK
jgi:hypothetical protein